MRSGAMRGLPWGIARCADIFGAAFPDGELHASPVNLGIALNFRRAERHVFLTRRHEYVLFLEDDFVLQPHYLQLVRAMIRQFGEHPRVGAFSAFGDNAASVASQRANRHRIKAMGHDWAFCVPRARWLERQPHYAAYLRYIRRVDYVLRSHDHIVHRLYPRLGARSDISSQDGAKTIAMLNAGQVKLSTYTNNGYYIGRMGTHFTPRIFARMGYRERERLVFEELEERLDWTTADLDGIEAQLRAAFLQ